MDGPRSLIRARNDLSQRRKPLHEARSVFVDQRAMADFAPGARALAVVVQMGAGNAEHRVAGWKAPDQVQHRSVTASARVSERPAEHGA